MRTLKIVYSKIYGVFVALLWLPSFSICSIIITNGVYSGITVGISSDLLEIECGTLVNNIKNTFTDASAALYTAIYGLSFGSLTIVVPDTWSSCGNYSVKNAEGYITYNSAAFRVGLTHPLFKNEPWTQQPRGCGMPGDFVSISSEFIASKNPKKGTRLVQEWAKYRWGIFEEYGHYDDPVHPESYRLFNGTWSPNYCTNEYLNGDFSSTCYESTDCQFSISDSQASISSIMAVPMITQVTQFCDNSTHKSNIPSKHNLLCGGRSSWDVILQHPDLALYKKMNSGGTSRDYLAANLNIMIVKESTATRLVIVYETSQAMTDLPNRYFYEQEAIAQFIMYEAPSSAKVGLVSFSTVPIEKSNLLLLDDANRMTLANEVLDTKTSKDEAAVNLELALNNAASLLSTGNGTIILLTKCTEENPVFSASELAAAADGHPVWVILYPALSKMYLETFSGLALLTGGQLMVYEEEQIKYFNNTSYYTNPTMRLKLSQAFRQLLHQETSFDKQEIDTQTCTASDSPCKKSLNIKSDFDNEMNLYAYHTYDYLIGSITVAATGGTCQREDYNEKRVITTAVWKCNVGPASTSVDVTVSSKGSNSVFILELVGTPTIDTSGFEFQMFGSTNLYSLQYDAEEAPAIYVQPFYMGRSVVYASISLTVFYGAATAQTSNVIYMSDNGTGVDVTGNDGIYSGHLLPVFPLGDLYLTIYANDNLDQARLMPSTLLTGEAIVCCGSSIPLPSNLDSVPSFAITKSPIRATVVKSPTDLDYPPGKIKDLKYAYDSSSPDVVVLTFTATGEDLDYGTATKYKIRHYLESSSTMSEKTLDQVPNPSGTKESLKISIQSCDTGDTVTILAVDKSNQDGLESNPAIMYFPCVLHNHSKIKTGGIIGIVIGCLLLVAIIIVIIYFLMKDKNADDNRGKHSKLSSCTCCENDEGSDVYNSPPPKPLRKPDPPKVELIKNINDLNMMTQNDFYTENENIQTTAASRNSINDDAGGFEANIDYINEDKETYSGNPMSAFAKDSFKFTPGVERPESEISLSSSDSTSHYQSQVNTRPINQVGVPLPFSYSRTPSQFEGNFVTSAIQQPPPVPAKKSNLFNTQV